MSNTVFILGAGASRDAGVPLMAEFLDVAHKLWKQGEVQDYEQQFRDVFSGISALQDVHSKSQLDFNNVESVFAAFETAATLGKFPRREVDRITSLVNSLKVLIAVTIERTMRLPVTGQNVNAPVPYDGFAQLVEFLRHKVSPPSSVTVITFNYDLGCDYAMWKAGIPIDYALGEGANESAIPVLKLHGSLNWAYCPDRNAVVPWTLNEYFRYRGWTILHNEVRSVRWEIMPQLKEFQFDGKPVDHEPVLVPPTWNKAEHHRNLASVWSRAAKELSDAENIYIAGYSLPETDAFFRYLYALGTVGDTLLKRVWVFNPDKTVESRFRAMLGPAANSRFQFRPESFASGTDHLGKVFSPSGQEWNRFRYPELFTSPP